MNGILNSTSKWPMHIATSQCQLVATDSLVVSGSITSSEGEFSNCIGCEKQQLKSIKV